LIEVKRISETQWRRLWSTLCHCSIQTERNIVKEENTKHSNLTPQIAILWVSIDKVETTDKYSDGFQFITTFVCVRTQTWEQFTSR
jgi:hypothetical protein